MNKEVRKIAELSIIIALAMVLSYVDSLIPTIREEIANAGLITLNEDDLTTYSYETVYMFDMALEEGSELTKVDGGMSKFTATFMRFFRGLLNKIHEVFYKLPF